MVRKHSASPCEWTWTRTKRESLCPTNHKLKHTRQFSHIPLFAPSSRIFELFHTSLRWLADMSLPPPRDFGPIVQSNSPLRQRVEADAVAPADRTELGYAAALRGMNPAYSLYMVLVLCMTRLWTSVAEVEVELEGVGAVVGMGIVAAVRSLVAVVDTAVAEWEVGADIGVELAAAVSGLRAASVASAGRV